MMPRRGYRPSTRGGKAKPKPRGARVYTGLLGRGGARAGAGRKPDPVPWGRVRKAAEAGAPYEEIISGLEIPAEALQQRAVQEKLRTEIDKGNTKFKLRLRAAIKYRGIKEGSVNSLALMARNALDWDQQLAQAQAPPDLTGIGARLADLVEKAVKRAGA